MFHILLSILFIIASLLAGDQLGSLMTGQSMYTLKFFRVIGSIVHRRARSK